MRGLETPALGSFPGKLIVNMETITIRPGDRFIVLHGKDITTIDKNEVQFSWPFKDAAEADGAFSRIMEYAEATWSNGHSSEVSDDGHDRLVANVCAGSWRDPEPVDSRNRWAKQLGSGHTYDAGKLLDIIRPEVETILVTAGFTSPPSQSMRVMECLETMETRYGDLMKLREDASDPAFVMKQGFAIRKVINVLKAFQAVHKTITLLEGTVI